MTRAPRALLRRILFRHGWDTRCRHRGPARVLRDAMAKVPVAPGPALLDVGCGRAGMAAFLEELEVVGVDLEPQQELLRNRTFTQASIDELPFPDRSFPLVSCIDVLQELPLDVRERGLAEMVRVARHGLVVAAPNAEVAADADAAFESALRARGGSVPAWVQASRAHPYPTVEGIVAAIGRADPAADVTVSYSEPVRITRLVRAAAVRSGALYAAVNLLFGALSRAIPAPSAARAYRMVLVVRRG